MGVGTHVHRILRGCRTSNAAIELLAQSSDGILTTACRRGTLFLFTRHASGRKTRAIGCKPPMSDTALHLEDSKDTLRHRRRVSLASTRVSRLHSTLLLLGKRVFKVREALYSRSPSFHFDAVRLGTPLTTTKRRRQRRYQPLPSSQDPQATSWISFTQPIEPTLLVHVRASLFLCQTSTYPGRFDTVPGSHLAQTFAFGDGRWAVELPLRSEPA